MRFLIVALFCLPLHAATYYVSTTGDDSTGTGEISTPWKTVKKGVESISAGDTLYIRGGSYSESVWPPTWPSGAEGSPIQISAYNGEYVYITQTTANAPQDLVRLTSQKYVTFSGLDLDNSNADQSIAGANVVKITTSADKITFTNCVIRGAVRGHGILMNTSIEATGNTIVDCTFRSNPVVTILGDSPPHNIYIQSPFNLVDRCTFYKTNNNSNIQIFDNGAHSNIIRNCSFKSGSISLILAKGDYNKVYNCTFLSNSSWGIVIGDPSSPPTGTEVSNCSFQGGYGAFTINNPATNVIVRNMLIGPGTASDSWAFAVDVGGVNTVLSNLVVDINSPTNTGYGLYYLGGQNTTAFNLYTNVSAGMLSASEFSLLSSSYAIDRGTPVPDFSTDIVGTLRPKRQAWDIGAYEFNQAIRRRSAVYSLSL